MAIPHAKPGEVVNVRPLGAALATTGTRTLVKTKDIEVIRLIVPAGKEIPSHKAKGEIVVQCLEGKVAFTAFGKSQNLEAGQMLYLHTGEPHSVKGIEDASLLLTVLLPKH
jgi:quercetin dioxygenase-like cupin family protein